MRSRKTGLYMKAERFKKVKKRISEKKRSLNLLSKTGMMFTAGRFKTGLFFMLLVAVNFKMCMPEVDVNCIPCMTGERAETAGVVTKVEVTSYGAKGYNDYKMYYAYTVNGKSYNGIAADRGKGLTYMENHPVVVEYSAENHACSCVKNMECLAESGLFTVITGAVLFLTGIIFILSAIRLISRAIAVLEYGDIANATVIEIFQEKKSNPFNFGGPAAIHRYITLNAVKCGFTTRAGKNLQCKVYAKSEDTVKKGDVLTVIYDPDIPVNSLVAEALPRSVKTNPEL